VKWVCLALGAVALAAALTGCAVSDPTENEFGLQIVNNTGSTATVAYCSGSSSCRTHWWKVTLSPGRHTAYSVSAGPRSLSVFVVTGGGDRRCIRLAHYGKSISLSGATHAACHPPYG
jgi:hypothetical protein